MAIKLIVFDLDGTLVDSCIDIANALNNAGKKFGIGPVTAKEAQGLIGGGINKLIERLLAKEQIGVDKTALLRDFLDNYSLHLTDHTRPYPRVRETLADLNGITKVVLSNKVTALTVEIVKRFGLAPFFGAILGGDAVAEKKPAPTAILALLTKFAAEKNEAMIVGDSMYDMEAGRRAGIHTVAAMYGYGSPGFDDDAEFRIRAFAELSEIVHEFNNSPRAS
jgi:phosphoglycolate phosphatase